MRIAVTGSRNMKNYSLVKKALDLFCFTVHNKTTVTIINGGAHGADELSSKYSREVLRKQPVVYEANWAKFGNAAGPIRNSQMAAVSDICVAFPGGKGTHDMIRQCLDMGVTVYKCDLEDDGTLRVEEIKEG